MAPDFKALRNQLNLCCPEDQTEQANLEVFIAKSLKRIRRPEAAGQGFYRIHVALTPPCGENLTHRYAWLLMENCFIGQQTSSAQSICMRVHERVPLKRNKSRWSHNRSHYFQALYTGAFEKKKEKAYNAHSISHIYE